MKCLSTFVVSCSFRLFTVIRKIVRCKHLYRRVDKILVLYCSVLGCFCCIVPSKQRHCSSRREGENKTDKVRHKYHLFDISFGVGNFEWCYISSLSAISHSTPHSRVLNSVMLSFFFKVVLKSALRVQVIQSLCRLTFISRLSLTAESPFVLIFTPVTKFVLCE